METTYAAFAALGLEVTEFLQQVLRKEGIPTPTSVQGASIPKILAGEDVIVQSGTGTGKTLAYLLPLLQRIRNTDAFRAVVIAPSPELATQILRVVETYKGPGLRSASLVGSGNIERQKERLKTHPHIVVGTPGRALEMIFNRKLKTRDIKALVLDEMDQIFSGQNESELREICSRPEFDAQIILASATFGRRAEDFADDYMDEARVHVQLGSLTLLQNIAHRFFIFPHERTELDLARIIKRLEIDRCIVFVHKAFHVPKLFHALNDLGIHCVTISAERNKHQREEALEALRKGEARVLVATDTTARGLDIKDLQWVIHYEPANDKSSYLHRAGRTGRAGMVGTSLSMITADEMPTLQRRARELHIDIAPLEF